MKKNQIILLALIALFSLSSCKERECIVRTPAEANIDFVDTPYTDSMKFAQAGSLEGKKFAGGEASAILPSEIDHYGYVSLRSVTDGDTANFIQEGFVDQVTNTDISIKTRFLGINTPESTAKVEPWGKKASIFVRNKLTSAQEKADEESLAAGRKICNIALVTDVENFGERDTSGNRWLAFVWYRYDSHSEWRCLNLEIVEQAYSMNQLFTDSNFCNYRKTFEEVDKYNKRCRYRVYGEIDDGYDYTEQIVETNLWYVINNFDELGINDETGSSGFMLHVLALVVGIQGDSLYLRDIELDDEQNEGDTLASLYAYAGFNSAIASILNNANPETKGVGSVVYFYARATIFAKNIQLSDIQNKTTGKRAFRVINEDNVERYLPERSWANFNLDYSSVRVEPSSITSQEDIGAYKYQWIDTEIELRKVSPYTDDENEDKGSSRIQFAVGAEPLIEYWVKTSGTTPYAYSYYAKIAGTNIICNLRADASLNPQVVPQIFDPNYGEESFNIDDVLGKTFHVTGYVVSYFERYQIQLANNYQQFNYIYEVI